MLNDMTTKDIMIFIIALVTIIGTMVLIATNHDVPSFIVAGVSGIFTYFFGLLTNTGNNNGN